MVDIDNDCDLYVLFLLVGKIDGAIRDAVVPVESLEVLIQNAKKEYLESESTLLYVFDVEVKLRSSVQQHNLEAYVTGGFNSEDEEEIFLSAVRLSGECPLWMNASDFRLATPSSSQLQTPAAVSETSGAQGAVLVAGLVAALAAGAILTAIFVFVRIVGRRNNGGNRIPGLVDDSRVQDLHDHEAISEIGLEACYEISTLGDPPIVGSITEEEPQETSTNDSFSLDYDYQKPPNPKAYSCSSVSESDVSMKSNPLVSRDDDTLEAQYVAGEQFEVFAPPGVLGLILDTNTDGIPIVTNVKSSSVLSDAVKPGDRLLAVDGVDVVLMMASDISRIIANKKNQPERHLLFARPITHDLSSAGSLQTK